MQSDLGNNSKPLALLLKTIAIGNMTDDTFNYLTKHSGVYAKSISGNCKGVSFSEILEEAGWFKFNNCFVRNDFNDPDILVTEADYFSNYRVNIYSSKPITDNEFMNFPGVGKKSFPETDEEHCWPFLYTCELSGNHTYFGELTFVTNEFKLDGKWVQECVTTGTSTETRTYSIRTQLENVRVFLRIYSSVWSSGERYVKPAIKIIMPKEDNVVIDSIFEEVLELIRVCSGPYIKLLDTEIDQPNSKHLRFQFSELIGKASVAAAEAEAEKKKQEATLPELERKKPVPPPLRIVTESWSPPPGTPSVWEAIRNLFKKSK